MLKVHALSAILQKFLKLLGYCSAQFSTLTSGIFSKCLRLLVTFTQGLLHFFCLHFSIVMQRMKFADKFFVAFSLLRLFHFIWFDKVFGQPLTVA